MVKLYENAVEKSRKNSEERPLYLFAKYSFCVKNRHQKRGFATNKLKFDNSYPISQIISNKANLQCSYVSPPWKYATNGSRTVPSAESSNDAP